MVGFKVPQILSPGANDFFAIKTLQDLTFEFFKNYKMVTNPIYNEHSESNLAYWSALYGN